MSRRRLSPDMLPNWPRYLTRSLAAAYLGLSEEKFQAEVNLGWWPAPVRRRSTERVPAWDRVQIDQEADRQAGLTPRAAPQDSADLVGEVRRRIRAAAPK